MSHLLFPWKITHNHVHHSASPPCAFCSFLDLYLGLQKPGVQHLSFIGLPAAPLAAWSSVGPKFGTGNAFQKHCPNNQVPNTSTFCNHHYYHTSSISSDAGQGGSRCSGAHLATSLSKSSLPLSNCFSSSWEGSPSTLISQFSHWSLKYLPISSHLAKCLINYILITSHILKVRIVN